MESSVRYAPSQPRGISHDVRDELSALESDVRKLMHSVQSMEAIDTLSKFELRMGKLIGEVESLLGASSHPPEANSVPTSGSASLTPGDPPKTDEDILAHFFDDDETIGASLGKQPDSNVPPVDDKSPLGMVPPGPHESPIEVNLE